MGIRRRYAFVYPGNSRVGVALVVVDERRIKKVACGSLLRPVAEEYASAFHPETIIYATDHTPARGGVFRIFGTPDRLSIAHSGWFDRKVYNPIRERVGIYGNLAYRMMFHELVTREDYTWSDVKLDVLDQSWVEANSPPRILR